MMIHHRLVAEINHGLQILLKDEKNIFFPYATRESFLSCFNGTTHNPI